MVAYGPPTYICTRKGCGRIVCSTDSEFPMWLVARRVDDPAKVVVRCPQHVTDRTLRYAGIERSKQTFRDVRTNRINDEHRSHSIVLPGSIVEMDPALIKSVLDTGRTNYEQTGKRSRKWQGRPGERPQ